MKTALILCVIILVLSVGISLAVEPSGKTQEPGTQSDILRSSPEGGPLPFPEQMVAGEVTASDGSKLGGVAVKLFANGRLVEMTHTSTSGAYEIPLPVGVEKDETVIMWFVPGTDNLVPQNVILKKSSKAAAAGLFSKCTPEVRMRPQMRVDARLLSDSEYLTALKAQGCL